MKKTNSQVKKYSAATSALLGGNGTQSKSICFARLNVDMLETVIAHPLAVYVGQNKARWITVECYLNADGIGGLRLVQSDELRAALDGKNVASMGVCRRTLSL